MALSAEQYMALSALSYTDYPALSSSDTSHPSIQQLVQDSSKKCVQTKYNQNINKYLMTFS
jgi:hypothetical protein